jgi:hypothetical protein
MSPNITRASGFTRFSNPSVRTFQFSDNTEPKTAHQSPSAMMSFRPTKAPPQMEQILDVSNRRGCHAAEDALRRLPVAPWPGAT